MKADKSSLLLQRNAMLARAPAFSHKIALSVSNQVENSAPGNQCLVHFLCRQEAKRKKSLPAAPIIVGKGSAFTPGVWANAALLVDKPKAWTSFDVCAKLRGALKTKKVTLVSICSHKMACAPKSYGTVCVPAQYK